MARLGAQVRTNARLPAEAESLLQPFVQKGRDRTGLGLGLSIGSKAVKVLAGELRIRDLPGKGCIFTIDLPKQSPPPTSIRPRAQKATDGPPGAAGGGTARSARA